MKVIFDCTTLVNWNGHSTGIQRVVIELGKRLGKSSSLVSLGSFDRTGTCRGYHVERRTYGEVIELRPNDLVITAGANWDYLDHHARLIELRAKGVRIATLFHDIIPLILPFSYGPGLHNSFKKWFHEAIESSDFAFANSAHTRHDVITYAEKNGLKHPTIYVVRLGDEIPSNNEPSRHTYIPSAKQYILSVGTLEYRKNHIILLNAYRYLVDVEGYEPPQLLIVGKRGWLDHDIEYQVANDPRLAGRVQILQGVADADLLRLYQSAMFTVYPSFYEGWGLPVAESLCLGKPCIASRTSSLTEIAPGLVRHAHPLRVDEWANAIREYTDHPELLGRATKAVQAGYKKVSWVTTASQMLDSIKVEYPELLPATNIPKLFFDCSTILHWSANATGIPRTVFCLAIAMRNLRPDLIFVALDKDLGCFQLVTGSPGDFKLGGVAHFSEGDALFSAGAGWSFSNYQTQILAVKASGARFYQVFYDLIPTMFPQFYEQGVGFAEYFSHWTNQTLSLCDGAFAISSCTKNDLVSWFEISDARAECIKVIRLGEDFFSPETRLNHVTRFGSSGGYLLSVGTLEVRKNQTLLLDAYRLLAKRCDKNLPKLILVGRKGWLGDDITSEINSDNLLNGLIEVVIDVDDSELHWLYENCLFSLFPALYEGWGLPVAESLKAGRPCICSGVSSMLEIAPQLTVFAPPYSPEDWAAAISFYLLHPNELRDLSEKIKTEYVPTLWSQTASSILKEINI